MTAKWKEGDRLWVKAPRVHHCTCGNRHEVLGERVLVEVVVEAAKSYGYGIGYWVHPRNYDSTYAPATSGLFHRWIHEGALSTTPNEELDPTWDSPI